MKAMKDHMKPTLFVLVLLLCLGIVGHFDYEDAMRTEQQRPETIAREALPQEKLYAITLKCRAMPIEMQSPISRKPRSGIVRTALFGMPDDISVFQCIKT